MESSTSNTSDPSHTIEASENENFHPQRDDPSQLQAGARSLPGLDTPSHIAKGKTAPKTEPVGHTVKSGHLSVGELGGCDAHDVGPGSSHPERGDCINWLPRDHSLSRRMRLADAEIAKVMFNLEDDSQDYVDLQTARDWLDSRG